MRMLVRTVLTAIWLMALARVGLSAQAGNGEAAIAAKTTPYDLTVIVYAPEAGPAQVAMSYPRLVDHDAIRKGLDELAQRTRSVLAGTNIVDGQQGRGISETGTAVEFAATGLVREGQGALPVGPIIRSLPNWQHMRLVFVVGATFRWVGPQSAYADGFAVQVISSMKPIEYDVERKNRALAPPAGAKAQIQGAPATLPAVLIGLPAGFAIGWLIYGFGGGRDLGSEARGSRRKSS